MSLLKYIYRLKRMDDLIRRKATGNAEEFAEKLGISISVLKENLSEMRELGAPVNFCRNRKSYFYVRECRLLLYFEDERLNSEESAKIKGGNSFLDYFLSSRITGR